MLLRETSRLGKLTGAGPFIQPRPYCHDARSCADLVHTMSYHAQYQAERSAENWMFATMGVSPDISFAPDPGMLTTVGLLQTILRRGRSALSETMK